MNTRDLKLTYSIPYPIDRVWNAVTVNEVLVQWLADKVTGRPILGEKFSWSWKFGNEGEYTTNGIYKSIEPGKSIELKWLDHPAGDIELKLNFIQDGENSKLELINSGYPILEKFDNWVLGAKAGWDDQVEKLKEFLGKWNGVVPPKNKLKV
ncbi:MAG: SRPBCC domain-containing protein [Leptospiraceae bacterium]|nr:SRPBCC domain-containing protein [Leptospiraceae bacterium]MCK6380824.1 SRPBCC domain-containing protein [Leptospiraceae bacterium]NUM40775.1 SRPBCC domain-containing protein [Leptospiraceae bacterium]